MQEPSPVLKYVELETNDDTPPVAPDSFLGGLAPDLGNISLTGIPIPFPGLREPFLSTTDLAFLSLDKIPHSGYFSPEAIVTCLSALTSLQGLNLAFESPRSRPPRRPPPLTRTVLPALRVLLFTGVSEYLEDLVARINAPPLCLSQIIFFHQLEFNTPQLAQFISRRNEAPYGVFADAVDEFEGQDGISGLKLKISCRQSEWQLSAVAQVCSSFLQAFIPTLERLYIENGSSQPRLQDDIENSQWLELLGPFTAVKDLFLTNELAPRIAPALQDLVGERADEVLPALQRICFHPVSGGLGGVAPKAIDQLVDARRLSNHPIETFLLSHSQFTFVFIYLPPTHHSS